MINYYVRAVIMKERMMEELRKEDGLGTVEIAIIIIVLIGLALMFRTKIMDYLGKVFDTINNQDITVQTTN